jgi:alpha-tubulin suppressor-like RCC1 family protein
LGHLEAINTFTQPVINLPAKAVQIALGENHTCALLSDGSVYCWGSNEFGQSGTGQDADKVPFLTQPVSPIRGDEGDHYTFIAAGDNFTCGILQDGPTRCWGSNHYGQIPNTETTTAIYGTPIDIGELNEIVALDLGRHHGCAITSSNEAICWGSDDSDQTVPDGIFANESALPEPVDLSEYFGSGTPVAQIETYGNISCASSVSSIISCWGERDWLTPAYNDPVFTLFPTGIELLEFAIGQDFLCVKATDGNIKCLGDNGFGQLGSGDSESPTSSYEFIEISPLE